jgi:hypothetical protein
VKKFREETGCEPENQHELTKEEMEEYRFTQDGICGFGGSFGEELEQMLERGDIFPCFFAATE